MQIFIGIEGFELSNSDILRLKEPIVCGVVLFQRNFLNFEQLKNLCSNIRQINNSLLICVDCEGGRVQRFRGQRFTNIPSASEIGELYDLQPEKAIKLAYASGLIISYELINAGLDFSFAPVLDLRDQISTVIGHRAYHSDPAVVYLLSSMFRRGLSFFGMSAIGKHFPGHGRVKGDSHCEFPQECRSYTDREADRLPFLASVLDGIEAIMTAHIIMPEENNSIKLASFSKNTVQILRNAGFNGAIISDDLDMKAARFMEMNHFDCCKAAYEADLDAVMICNSFADMDKVLFEHKEELQKYSNQASIERINKLAVRKPSFSSADHDIYLKALGELQWLEN